MIRHRLGNAAAAIIIVAIASLTSLSVSGNIDAATEITIEDFTSPETQINDWRTLNDPVMGGKSWSTLEIADGAAEFRGMCTIVPSLNAPGFVTIITGGGGVVNADAAFFPDVSSCDALKIIARSTVDAADYGGYYVSFGTDRAPKGDPNWHPHRQGYKASIGGLLGTDYGDIVVPFDDFSSDWDEGTGKTITPCQEDARYCPAKKTLRNFQTMSFWGEGVEGGVALDISYIGAVGCDLDGAAAAKNYNSSEIAADHSGATTAASSASSDGCASDCYDDMKEDEYEFKLHGLVLLCAFAFAVAMNALRKTYTHHPFYERISEVENLNNGNNGNDCIDESESSRGTSTTMTTASSKTKG